MALSCFDDRSTEPTASRLREALGPAGDLWGELLQHMSARHAPIEEEWAFSGAQYGWSLRLVQKKRRLLYLIPQTNRFMVGVVLGEKAVAAANRSPLPRALLAELNSARKYAEGRGLRVVVSSRDDLEAVKRLAALKVGK